MWNWEEFGNLLLVYRSRTRTARTCAPKMQTRRQTITPKQCKRSRILCKHPLLSSIVPKLRTKQATKKKKLWWVSRGRNYWKLTWEQLPLSKLVSFSDQQQCSWFSQNACGQIPNLRSVIHEAPISMTPATAPVRSPTKSTQSHPDHASWAPAIKFQRESCFFLTIYRCRIRSRAISLCQSMVWKSSYCPIPGISPDSARQIEYLEKKSEKMWDGVDLPCKPLKPTASETKREKICWGFIWWSDFLKTYIVHFHRLRLVIWSVFYLPHLTCWCLSCRYHLMWRTIIQSRLCSAKLT